MAASIQFYMGKEQLADCDSDSSEGLPDLFTKCNFDVTKVVKNDIVWAEYKGLYWPAIVRHTDKKNRKVKIWYLDYPGKCFYVSFKKIHDFYDAKFRKEVEDEAMSLGVKEKHDKVVRRTDVFIYRKFRGIVDNPLEFFDCSKPYFLLKEFDLDISNVTVDNGNASTNEICDKIDGLTDSSESDSDVESCTITKHFPELCEENSPYDDEMVDKILSCITSGHVDNYLIDILNSKITNERHDLYLEAVNKDEMQLFVKSQPLSLINNQKLNNVSIYLHGLYKQHIREEKPKMNEYIVSVWLPEAIDKAITLIEGESSKLSDNSCGNNESSSSLGKEAFGLTAGSDNKEFPSSQISVELPNKASKLPSEGEASESLIDSSTALNAPKRKYRLHSSLAESEKFNELQDGACTAKKRFSSRLKQMLSSKALKSEKKFSSAPSRK